jgi:acyl carrier protein
VTAALRELCRLPLPNLSADTTLDELPDMDSLRVLHFIVLLEERFAVEIDVAGPDRMSSVRDLGCALGTAMRAAGGAADACPHQYSN